MARHGGKCAAGQGGRALLSSLHLKPARDLIGWDHGVIAAETCVAILRLCTVAVGAADRTVKPIERDKLQTGRRPNVGASPLRTWSRPIVFRDLAYLLHKSRGQAVGGLAMRKCTSAAPASRIISLILRDVVPRTTLSSTNITRLPRDQSPVHIQLQTHAHVANLLAGLNEGPAHILIANDAHGIGNARFKRKSNRRRRATVGHRANEVGFYRRFFGQFAADGLAGFINASAAKDAVGGG